MAGSYPREDRVVQAGEQRSARLESLRAIAALAVLEGHVALGDTALPQLRGDLLHRFEAGGTYGVYLFFALSGYLLYLPFARRDFGGARPVDLARYATNRAVRILPLYVFVVVFLLLVQEGGGTATQWWRFLTFTQMFSNTTAGTVDSPMWSLVVEVHFYVLLPLIAAGLALVGRRSVARAMVALGVVGLASLSLHPGPHSLWLFSFPVTFYFFASGMAVALLRVHVESSERSRHFGPADAWLAAAVVLWAIACWHHAHTGLLLAVGSGIVVGACVLPTRAGSGLALLSSRPLAEIGVISYSIYLWHVPLLRAITNADKSLFGGSPGYVALLIQGVIVSIAVAAVSYALIERPFLRLRRRWAATAAARPAVEPTAA